MIVHRRQILLYVAITALLVGVFARITRPRVSGKLRPAAGSPARPNGGGGNPDTFKKALASYSNLPLSFEANQGQFEPGIEFGARGQGRAIFLSSGKATFVFQEAAASKAQENTPLVDLTHLDASQILSSPSTLTTTVFTMSLVNARSNL